MLPTNHIRLSNTLCLAPIRPEDHPTHLALMQRIYPPAFAYLWPDKGAWYINHVHGKQAFLKDLERPDAPYYHVYQHEKLVGIFQLKLHALCPDCPAVPALKLDRMYLADEVRGQGIGKALVAYAREETRRKGKEILWLDRMDSNEATIGFYRKLGFIESGQFRLPFEQMHPEYRGMWRVMLRV
ncbi:GNAT family N-acetyltransferase [Neolewinella persica]|uniref:GNAT family N-acetyltransferase n=1 Tax=Neolewinella persica TaxID=70998 RepID=UPI00039CE350|nr:GNAT family N-acetyltransferase [Neolewinella persica]